MDINWIIAGVLIITAMIFFTIGYFICFFLTNVKIGEIIQDYILENELLKRANESIIDDIIKLIDNQIEKRKEKLKITIIN